mmetsp:Transcript_7463/g.23022  ORF Transcript_7463/g.23022 Transcript_7463/m.23022 type:complete len:200 (+) Transcript_7463:1097-1696(+)
MRVAARACPAVRNMLSKRAFDSFRISTNRAWPPCKSAFFATSVSSAKSSPVWNFVALPRKTSWYTTSSGSTTTSSTFIVVSRDADRPPVSAPILRCSVTASIVDVPVSVKSLAKYGMSGTSDSTSRPERSNATSTYAMPEVGRSLSSKVVCSDNVVTTSVPMVAMFGDRSVWRFRVGMVARASGVSGAAWRRCNSSISA